MNNTRFGGIRNTINKLMEVIQKPIRIFRGLNKTLKLSVVLIGVLLIAAGSMLILSAASEPAAQKVTEKVTDLELETGNLNATINEMIGTVERLGDNGDWSEIQEGETVNEADTLRTIGSASYASVKLGSNGFFRLSGNTQASFETLTEERAVLMLEQGYGYSRTTPSVDSDSEYRFVVKTDSAQFEALEAAFTTIADGDEESVEVYYGSVIETTSNTAPRTGEKLTVKNFSSPNKNGKLENIDTQRVKENQFALWNRELDLEAGISLEQLGIIGDIDPPKITIDNYSNGDIILFESSAKAAELTISGTTERGSEVTIQTARFNDGDDIEVNKVDNESFTSPTLTLPDGDHTITVTATDRSGNSASAKVRLTVRQKLAEEPPVQSPVISSNLVENGNAVEVSLTQTYPDFAQVLILYGQSQTLPFDGTSVAIDSNALDGYLESSLFTPGETYFFQVCLLEESGNQFCSLRSNITSETIPAE